MIHRLQIEARFGRGADEAVPPRRAEIASEHAGQVWAKLKYLYQFSIEAPELVSVRSHIAGPTLLTSNDAPPTLVYDHHLLDHIAFSGVFRLYDPSYEARRRAMFRLYAERLFCGGRLVDACATRAVAEHMEVSVDPPKINSNEIARQLARDNANQQKAIIAHELGHALLLSADDDLRDRLARGVVSTAGGVFAGNDAFGLDVDPSILGFGKPTDMFNQVIADPHILEEAVCDALALMGTLPPTINSGADVVEPALAIIQSLNTMQLTSVIDLATRGSGVIDQLTMHHRVIQSLARLLIFRAFAVAMTFQSLDYDADEGEIINQALAEVRSPSLEYLIQDFDINTLEHNLAAMAWTEGTFGQFGVADVRQLLDLDSPSALYFGASHPIFTE